MFVYLLTYLFNEEFHSFKFSICALSTRLWASDLWIPVSFTRKAILGGPSGAVSSQLSMRFIFQARPFYMVLNFRSCYKGVCLWIIHKLYIGFIRLSVFVLYLTITVNNKYLFQNSHNCSLFITTIRRRCWPLAGSEWPGMSGQRWGLPVCHLWPQMVPSSRLQEGKTTNDNNNDKVIIPVTVIIYPRVKFACAKS